MYLGGGKVNGEMYDFTNESKVDKYDRLEREIGGFSERVKNLRSYCMELEEHGFKQQACFACVDLWLLIEEEVEAFLLAKARAEVFPK